MLYSYPHGKNRYLLGFVRNITTIFCKAFLGMFGGGGEGNLGREVS